MVIFGGGDKKFTILPDFLGDEVNAIVVDIGTYETKVGYAGSDSPCFIYESCGKSCVSQKLELLEKAFTLPRLDPKEHPLMLVDSYWTPEEKNELIEIAFEKLNVPAIYFGQDAIFSAFAAGKSTALVVSSGHQGTFVSPVYDGYVLQKGMQKQSLGGKTISDYALNLFKENNIQVVPQCFVAKKSAVEPDQPAQYVHKKVTGMTPELEAHHIMKTIHDFKETLCQNLEVPFDENIVRTRPAKSYEFPNGFNRYFLNERYHIPEALFNPYILEKKKGSNTNEIAEFEEQQQQQQSTYTGIQNMVHRAIQSVDPDIRSLMYQNIVVTGGNTLFPGFIERLHLEMAYLTPGVKVKLHVPGSKIERKYAAWIGGSIVASLGTFHQLWISKEEYEEQGVSVLEKR